MGGCFNFFGRLHRHKSESLGLTRMRVVHDGCLLDLLDMSESQHSRTHFGKSGFESIVIHFAIQMSNVKVIVWIYAATGRSRAVRNDKAECHQRKCWGRQQYLATQQVNIVAIIASSDGQELRRVIRPVADEKELIYKSSKYNSSAGDGSDALVEHSISMYYSLPVTTTVVLARLFVW